MEQSFSPASTVHMLMRSIAIYRGACTTQQAPEASFPSVSVRKFELMATCGEVYRVSLRPRRVVKMQSKYHARWNFTPFGLRGALWRIAVNHGYLVALLCKPSLASLSLR